MAKGLDRRIRSRNQAAQTRRPVRETTRPTEGATTGATRRVTIPKPIIYGFVIIFMVMLLMAVNIPIVSLTGLLTFGASLLVMHGIDDLMSDKFYTFSYINSLSSKQRKPFLHTTTAVLDVLGKELFIAKSITCKLSSDGTTIIVDFSKAQFKPFSELNQNEKASWPLGTEVDYPQWMRQYLVYTVKCLAKYIGRTLNCEVDQKNHYQLRIQMPQHIDSMPAAIQLEKTLQPQILKPLLNHPAKLYLRHKDIFLDSDGMNNAVDKIYMSERLDGLVNTAREYKLKLDDNTALQAIQKSYDKLSVEGKPRGAYALPLLEFCNTFAAEPKRLYSTYQTHAAPFMLSSGYTNDLMEHDGPHTTKLALKIGVISNTVQRLNVVLAFWDTVYNTIETELTEAIRQHEAMVSAQEKERKDLQALAAQKKAEEVEHKLAEVRVIEHKAALCQRVEALIQKIIQQDVYTVRVEFDVLEAQVHHVARIVEHHNEHKSFGVFYAELIQYKEILVKLEAKRVILGQTLVEMVPTDTLEHYSSEALEDLIRNLSHSLGQYKTHLENFISPLDLFQKIVSTVVEQGDKLTAKADRAYEASQIAKAKKIRKKKKQANKTPENTPIQASSADHTDLNKALETEQIRKDMYYAPLLQKDVRFQLALHCLDLDNTLNAMLKDTKLDEHIVYGARQYIALKLSYAVYQLSSQSNPYVPLHDWIQGRELLYRLRNTIVHHSSSVFMVKGFKEAQRQAEGVCKTLRIFEMPLRTFNTGVGIAAHDVITLTENVLLKSLAHTDSKQTASIPCLLDNLKFYAQGVVHMRDAIKQHGFEKFTLNGPLQCAMQYYSAMMGECLSKLRKKHFSVYAELNAKVAAGIATAGATDKPARAYIEQNSDQTIFELKRNIVAHAFSEEDSDKTFGDKPHILDASLGREVYQDILPDELLKISQHAPFVQAAATAQLKVGRTAHNSARLHQRVPDRGTAKVENTIKPAQIQPQ